jgi:IAA-amino acid hydrolase
VACELQTIASREVDPLVPAVVSITALNGGSTFNVIPSEVRMLGTVRSLTGSGLVFLKQRVREIAVNVAAANRCEAQVAFPGNDYPPLVNDGRCWTLAAETARALLGQNSVQEAPPLMGGEDFAFYTERVPGCFMALGVGNQEKGATYGLHHPRFQVDEEALPIGTALHVGFAFRSLNELRGSS